MHIDACRAPYDVHTTTRLVASFLRRFAPRP